MLRYLRDTLTGEITTVANDERYTHDALSERLANAGLLPMFGFPTRVRLLHTNWPQTAYPWPPEYGTIDRDLDIAISQFAPKSETVRDKAVHTACGVFAPQPVGNFVRFDDGFAPPLPQPNTFPVRLCLSCQAVIQGGASQPASSATASPRQRSAPFAPSSHCSSWTPASRRGSSPTWLRGTTTEASSGRRARRGHH